MIPQELAESILKVRKILDLGYLDESKVAEHLTHVLARGGLNGLPALLVTAFPHSRAF